MWIARGAWYSKNTAITKPNLSKHTNLCKKSTKCESAIARPWPDYKCIICANVYASSMYCICIRISSWSLYIYIYIYIYVYVTFYIPHFLYHNREVHGVVTPHRSAPARCLSAPVVSTRSPFVSFQILSGPVAWPRGSSVYVGADSRPPHKIVF